MRNSPTMCNVVGQPRPQQRWSLWRPAPAGSHPSAPVRCGPRVAWPVMHDHREGRSQGSDHTALADPGPGQWPREPWPERSPEQPSPVTLPPAFTSASVQNADLHEVKRYLDGKPLHWSTAAKAQLLAHMAATGHKVDHMDLVKAFQEVRVVSIKAGEMLLQAEAPSSFVYIPLGAGLRVFPLGTHASSPALPWVPMGNTGVIRGSIRNARVMAEHDVELLSIPKEVYLKHWYRPYTVHEFTALCAQGTIQAMLPPA